MPVDASAIVRELPDWLQVAANIALFLMAILAGAWGLRKGHRDEKDRPAEVFDASKLLASSPILRLIDAVEILADNAPLQTEALKTTSAATVAMARLVEEDFDERRIKREVERLLGVERDKREART